MSIINRIWSIIASFVVAVALSVALIGSAAAQTATDIPGAYPTSAPSGYTAQEFRNNCNATPSCWPFVSLYDGTHILSLGTAGSAGAVVMTVQGIASMTPLSGNLTQLNGNAVSTGTGASGTGTQRVATSSDSPGGAAANPSYVENNPVGAANWTPSQVSVGSTATQILAARTGNPGTGRICATITNTSTTDVWLGGSGVTTSTGQLLTGVKGAAVSICSTAAVYGIVATGTETVSAFETY